MATMYAVKTTGKAYLTIGSGVIRMYLKMYFQVCTFYRENAQGCAGWSGGAQTRATADDWARRVQTSTFLSSAVVFKSLPGDWSATSSHVPSCGQSKRTHCSEYVATIDRTAYRSQRGRRTQ